MDWEKYAWIWNMSEGQGQTLKAGPEDKLLHPTAKANNHIMEDYHKADIPKGLR